MPKAQNASTKDATSTSKRPKKATKDASSALPDDAAIDLALATLDTLEKETMDPSWFSALEAEFTKSYFVKLKEFLRSEYRENVIFPPITEVYSWTRYTPLDKVKVVILGQDPYHDVGQAHGLSFSVLPPTKVPGSLKNIYKQLAAEDPTFVVPKGGDLSPLAKEGVLWLNTCLTVRAHQANSHSKKGWETLTAQALKAVVNRSDSQGVVFMLWGLPSQKAAGSIGIDETKHLVLKSAHPSPLSAHKGFLGNEHFKKANVWLKEKYGDEGMINWKAVCE